MTPSITITPDPERRGGWWLTIERRKTRRVWLSTDELAMIRAEIDRVISPVTVTRRPA